MPITIQTLTPGTGFTASCYILTDEMTGQTAIIDPGDTDIELEQLVASLDVRYILLTHRHYDHICGVARLKQLLPSAQVAIHALDACGLERAEDSLALFRGVNFTSSKADILLQDGDELALGGSVIHVLHTPGHTIGGACFMVEDRPALFEDNEQRVQTTKLSSGSVCGGTPLFSGDTLFCEGIGRLDLPTGDYEQMQASLQRLFALEGNFVVYPGHEKETTLSAERGRHII